MYDHVLDAIVLYGCVPQRYSAIPSSLDRYFALGRGLQRPSEGIDVSAMEMKKWFDTNCTSAYIFHPKNLTLN